MVPFRFRTAPLFLVIEIETDHQAAIEHVRSRQWREVAHLRLRVLVMERESCAAEHDGIPAITDGEGVDIAEVRSRRQIGIRLP